ncbi:MAG: NAD-dependent deacetylase [Porticoccus sp.]|jgi:NAD-dependent deacetylase
MTRTPYQSVVVLTGAGISAESEIRTFRASDGLWEEHHIEEAASPGNFERDPATVHLFYNQRREQLFHQGIGPNFAYLASADFEQRLSGELNSNHPKY